MSDSDQMRTGILWAGVEKFLVQGVAFAQGVILARLLCPQDFGLAAMLAIFIGIGVSLSEFGLGTALVVRGGDPWRIMRWNVGVSLACYSVLVLCAPLIADFYGIPRLRELTWVMAFSVVCYSFGTVPDACLQRAQRYRAIAWANGLSAVGSALATVSLALAGCGVWSIAACGLVSAVLRSGLLWLLAGCEVKKVAYTARETSPFRPTLTLGAKYAASGLLDVMWTHLAALMIGKVQNPVSVGLFNRADGWVSAARNCTNPIVARVAFPRLAADFGAGDGARARRDALRLALLNLILLWAGLAVLAIWTGPIVRMVFGAQWLPCVPYMRILILGAAWTPITNVSCCLVRASGQAGRQLAADVVRRSAGLAFLASGSAWGIAGVCWAKAASEFFDALVAMAVAVRVLAARSKGRNGRDDA